MTPHDWNRRGNPFLGEAWVCDRCGSHVGGSFIPVRDPSGSGFMLNSVGGRTMVREDCDLEVASRVMEI